jgi:hypothetical protein
MLCCVQLAPVKAEGVLSSFAGNWRGICQDGKPFVVLTLKVDGNDLVGDISIANMSGDNGQCVAVTDPPSPEHAMKISGATLAGPILSFRASSHAQFTMALDDAKTAKLRFLGTPVEDSPWRLTKTSGESRKE